MDEYQNILDGLPNNPDISSQIDASFINQSSLPGYQDTGSQPDPYSQSVIDSHYAQLAPEEIGPQGQAALYPGLNHNINVGNYSGSIVGSQGVYVPGGNVMAIDPVLSRRKAIADAAKAKAAQLQPFKYPDIYQLKDPGFQKKYSGLVNDYIESNISDTQGKYGKDFSVVLQDPSTTEGRKFIQGLANYEELGKNFDTITDEVAKIDEALATGEMEVPNHVLKMYDEYKNMIGNFDDQDIFTGKDLRALRSQIYSNFGLENLMNTPGFINNIMGEKSGLNYNADKGEFYSSTTKHVVDYDKAIKQVADSLSQGPMRASILKGDITKKEIEERLSSRFKKQVSVSGSMQQKSQATRDAEVEELISDSGSIVRYADEEGKRGQTIMPKYDENGQIIPGETYKLESFADANISLEGKKTIELTERLPNGKIQSTKGNFIPLNNVSIVGDNGGSKSIPGNAYADMTNTTETKLADGRVVVKARLYTTTKVPISEQGIKTGAEFDAYTSRDVLIELTDKKGEAKGGVRKQVQDRGIHTEEGKQKFDELFKTMKETQGIKPKDQEEEIDIEAYSKKYNF